MSTWLVGGRDRAAGSVRLSGCRLRAVGRAKARGRGEPQVRDTHAEHYVTCKTLIQMLRQQDEARESVAELVRQQRRDLERLRVTVAKLSRAARLREEEDA